MSSKKTTGDTRRICTEHLAEASARYMKTCFPLTASERGMYLEQMDDPSGTEYNVHLLYHIRGAERAAVDSALRAVFNAHEAFHSRYDNIEGIPVRIVMENLPSIHWQTAENRQAAEARALAEDAPFDLRADTPIRATGYTLETGTILLHIAIHHIAIDGHGAGLLTAELLARLKGDTPETSAPDLSDLAFDDSTDRLEMGRAYFESVFADGVPVSEMPVRGSRPRVLPPSNRCKSLELDADRLSSVESAAKTAGCTTFHFLFAAISIALSRYCASEDLVLGVPSNTRDARSRETIGMFVNMSPVRVRPRAEKPLAEYLREVAEGVRAAAHTHWLPFSEVVSRFGGKRDASRHPIFDVSVNYLYMPPSSTDGDISIELNVPLQRMRRDMSVTMRRCGTEMAFTLQYASELYDDALIERLLRHIDAILLAMQTNPGATVGEAAALPQAQVAELEALSCSATADIPEVLLHRMFERVADQRPEQIALVACDRTLTFSELNQAANRVAWNLMARGFAPGDSAVLLLPRRSCYFAAMFGVLKAGAAFIPCDPEYPAERIRHIISDSGAKCVITTEARMADYPGTAVNIEALLQGGKADNPDIELTGDNLAYMIYTSGSTGAPKGVMLRHRGICNYLLAHPTNIHYDILSREVTVLLSITTVAFDMSFKETTGALCNGKTLIFASEAEMNDPRALTTLLESTGADCFNATPSRLLQYLEYEPFRRALSRCKLVMSGGEGYPMALREKLRMALAPDAHIVNTYGPTEITVSSNGADITHADHISVGRPLLNVREYIVDARGGLAPRGVVGELYIGGPGVAAGYRNLPEQTAKSFVDFRGGRFYRSGDYAKWDEEGNVVILGRMDSQVKLRGLRIELGEVEAALSEQPGVNRAVAAVKEIRGQEYLCAYYTSDAPLDESALKAALSRKLTHYMVPAAMMRLAQIPVTANGKTDLKALPTPKINLVSEDMTPPSSETQQKIFDAVADIVGHRAFGIHAPFTDIGLTSLTLVSLMLKLSEAFHRDVTLSDLRAHCTVEALSAHLERAGAAKVYEIQAEYPLTQTQMGIYVECLANPGTTIYNIPVLWKLSADVDIERLKEAVVKAIDAHPAMKARLRERDGAVYALRNDAAPAVVKIIRRDAPIIPDALVRPYDLLNDALYRAEIYQTPEGSAFYLDMHHIASDGRSRAILQHDIEAAYAGNAIEAERFTGYEAALEEQENRERARYEQAKAWYEALLSDAQPTDLPPVPDENAGAVGLLNHITALDADAVRRFCQNHGVTANAFFNAVFGYALGVFAASEDVLFTTVYDGRNDSRLMRAVTMLVKTLPVRCRWTRETRVADYLADVRDQLSGSMDHDLCAFSEIARAYGVSADLMVAWQDDMRVSPTFCGAPAEIVRPGLDTAKSGLSIDVYGENGRIVFAGEHRPETWSAAFVAEFMRCMEQIAGEFMVRGTLGEVRPCSTDTEEMLKQLHDTDWPVAERPAYRLLQDSAARWPDRTAVIANGTRLTYAELNVRANRLGRLLRARGIGVEKLCAVMLRRGAEVYVARQGVLKAGGAFLSIDPEYPDDRVRFILEDANCGVLVTSRALFEERRALLNAPGIEVCFVEAAEDASLSPENLDIDVPFDALAYAIYTSGSTGRPKGVLLTQRNLVSFVDANPKNREILGYTTQGRISLALASIAFDVSIMEEFIPLSHGLTVVMANDDERYDHMALQRLCVENGVDILTCTPSLMANLLDDPVMLPAIQNLKSIDLGAEAFPAQLYGRIRAQNPGVYIMNGYGPTETTISCTMAVMDGGRVTIGTPNSNVKVVMTDARGHALPIGAMGEMVILGAGVGRGYQNRDDLTAKCFIQLWNRPAYRSGDLARLLPNGEIDFRGRRDNQVKLRGLRIELDEIENVMLGYPGLRLCSVVVRNNGAEDYLAGFFSAKAPVAVDQLTAFMRERLAAYMIPDVLVQLDEMPLTVNGKIDKKRLPDTQLARRQAAYEPPANDVEKAFCDRMAEILNMERVSATDDFFSLGGTSLSAMILVSFAIAQGWDLVYRNVFEYTTPRALAGFVTRERDEARPAAAAPETAESLETATAFEALRRNTAVYLDGIHAEPLGDVLLTGATGFLGIHVLRELLQSDRTKRVVCLVRGKKQLSPEARLKLLLEYYFNDTFDSAFAKRIHIVQADVISEDLAELLREERVDTIINCAAMVKHFAQDDIIERINEGGVKRLIEIALQKNARLIQISTESVAGQSVNGSVPEDRLFTERDFDIGQTLGTKYTQSKFNAERDILRAIDERGLRAKIIRVGNLMSRRSDGEFQINFTTNGFMNRLKAYVALGCFPMEDMDVPAEFSPIDSVAQAIALLSGVQDQFTVFHVDNCHCVHMANLIEALEHCGIKLEVVPGDVFHRRLKAMLTDEKQSLEVSSLVSYQSNNGASYRYINCSNAYTVKALYRLGFSWPIVTPEYIERAIRALMGLGFFDV